MFSKGDLVRITKMFLWGNIDDYAPEDHLCNKLIGHIGEVTQVRETDLHGGRATAYTISIPLANYLPEQPDYESPTWGLLEDCLELVYSI